MKTNFYLKSGLQTRITRKIRAISRAFKTSEIALVFEILHWIHKNVKSRTEAEYKNKVFRRRTASQIIESGFVIGCTDYALAFIVLSRAKGIPTKYIEAISQEWLEKGGPKHFKGHVFAEVHIGNKWYIVDPQGAAIKAWYGKRFHILAEGLDSWSIGIRNINDLRKRFLEFRKAYLK
jgi:hypothetical protein